MDLPSSSLAGLARRSRPGLARGGARPSGPRLDSTRRRLKTPSRHDKTMPNQSTSDKTLRLRGARQCVQGFGADLRARWLPELDDARPCEGECAAMKLLRQTTIAALMTLAVACGRRTPEPESRQGAVE